MDDNHVAAFFTILIFLNSELFLVSSLEDLIWEECSLSCGGGIQRMKNNKNNTRMCNIVNCPGDGGCITTHFDFENIMEGRIYDTSKNANHGDIKGGATLDEDGKFGKCLHFPKNSNISLGSQTFHNRPSSAITVALWVKLSSIGGVHEMFHTCKSDSKDGEYHFEVKDGKVRWFHRDHMGRTVFNAESETTVAAMTWTHIAGTYRTSTRESKIYINGERTRLSSQKSKIGASARIYALSPEWSCANIGDFQNKRPLDGYMDDFFIFKCELMEFEIKELFQTGSFKKHEIPVP